MAISFSVSGFNAPNEDAFQDDEATAQRAAAAIRAMTGALDALGEAGSVTRAPGATARVFPLAFGWFAAIVRNAQLVALAHENGLRHESAASARLVLQHAMALQWLIEGGDPAANAVEAEGRRNAFDLVKELADTNWPLPAGFTLQPGDAIFFDFLTVHGAPGFPFRSRRRVLSLRYLAADARHAPRRWRTSPPFDGLQDELPAGAVMDHPLFPVVWPGSGT